VSLPVNPGLADAEPASPLAIDGVSILADGNALYALRLSNGQSAWHRESGAVKNPGQGPVAPGLAPAASSSAGGSSGGGVLG
jgi:hypothetical protein